MLIRCSAIHKIIGLPKSKNDRLTQTAKSHLIAQAKQELFGVDAFDGSKETEKGNVLEPFAIQGSGLIRGRQYAKNTERRENDCISGECDIHDPKHRLIIDTKCSWDIKTHPFFREEAERKVKEAGYDWQMQGYISAPSLTMPESRAGQAKKTPAATSRSTTRNAVRFILRITCIRPSIRLPASRCVI